MKEGRKPEYPEKTPGDVIAQCCGPAELYADFPS